MNLITATYQDRPILFTENGWFNATDVAKSYGKEPSEWLRLPSTVEYLAALERKSGKIPYYTTRRGRNGGTWLHPKLGVRFAQWLDVDFAVWCDEQIDALLRGQHPAFDWKRARSDATASGKVMNAVLRLFRLEQGKSTAAHHYSNESRLVNWALTGEFTAIDRNQLDAADLALLAALEETNTVLIGLGWSYPERKTALERRAQDARQQRLH